jgi:NTE family protein
MSRVGLVLGAGGTVGQAYHAGVLAALEHDLGWDPRSADVIVGTSAGSVTGALLRVGVPAHDLAAWAVDAPLSVETMARHQDYLDREPPTFPPLSLDYWLRRWQLPPAGLVRRIATRPWAIRPSVLASAMMPAGEVDLIDHVSPLDEVIEAPWPEALWVCATRRDDGARVVFGRPGAPPAPLSAGVAASCAIPGYFAPIELHGRTYFDGGVVSPSNADVLRSRPLDLVIAIAPMSAAGGLVPKVDAALRYSVHRRLERELAILADRGTTVVRIEPAGDALDAMGVNMMAQDRADEVVQAAFVETGRYCATARIARRLAQIVQRPGRFRSLTQRREGAAPAPHVRAGAVR